MHVSASIMAHPARSKSVERLCTELGQQVPVHWDMLGAPSPRSEKRWANGANAWKMHHPDADWHLVLQDDAMVCADLLDALPTVLQNVPGDGPVSLYLGAAVRSQPTQKAIRQADDNGFTWLGLPIIGWGVAIAAPVDQIDDMLLFAHNLRGKPYDHRIGKYFEQQRVPAWFTWPSLVQHDMTQRSLVGHAGSHRRAYRAHRGSAFDIDWSAGYVLDERAQHAASTE